MAAFVHQFKVKSASPLRGGCNFHGPKYIPPSLIYINTLTEKKSKEKILTMCADNLLSDATMTYTGNEIEVETEARRENLFMLMYHHGLNLSRDVYATT